MYPRSLRAAVSALLFLVAAVATGFCDDVLFIGNSYTYGGPEPAVRDHGGVPKLVERIAASKGKSLVPLQMTVPGKDWGFHLGNPATLAAMQAKAWDAVVLQDYSAKPTHLGNREQFQRNGENLFDLITKRLPHARVVLYETWARAEGHAFYTGKSTPKSFTNPVEMMAELHASYVGLREKMSKRTPGTEVLVAPVGTAFAQSLAKYPAMKLHGPDLHHASARGSYLAALVIYATLFHDSPLGATAEFPAFKVPVEDATRLQQVANEATRGLQGGSARQR